MTVAHRSVKRATLAACGLFACALSACADADAAMTRVAERYVRLALAVGVHDADYVDAYYGPPQWREEANARARSLEEIDVAAASLLAELRGLPSTLADEMLELRRAFLLRQIEAVRARVALLRGRHMTFDQESRALYDAVAPTLPESHFEGLIAELDDALPPADTTDGDSAAFDLGVGGRYEAWMAEFVVPADRLDTVFTTAIAACRERTARRLTLPPGEEFQVEYVTGKSWSGYNWYQGNYHSLIQVNVDLPITIDRAIDLACHEGYPGHHLYNVLLEHHLVRQRGWIEFSVYPLFSPQSLIAEGSANYGVEVAFPADERLAFERDVLFPLAGLDTSRATAYARVREVVGQLSYAGNEAARRYLDGRIDAAGAARWLERYALMSPERARQRVRFIAQYRSYVINYNLGRDLVADFIEARAPDGDPAARWAAFEALLSSPRVASTLDGT